MTLKSFDTLLMCRSAKGDSSGCLLSILTGYRSIVPSILPTSPILGEIGLLQATTSSMTLFAHGEQEFVIVAGGGAVLVARQTSNVGPVRFNIWQFYAGW